MKVYVSTYKKYNEGKLAGEWLNLDDYDNQEEFYAACYKLVNEKDPELMFQDFDGDDLDKEFYSESSISPVYWDVKDKFDDPENKKAFLEYASYLGDIREALEKYEDAYIGNYNSMSDYAEEYFENIGVLEKIPEEFRFYIDYESMGDDMAINQNLLLTSNGQLFQC